MVSLGNKVILFGGYSSSNSTPGGKIKQLTCGNHICKWNDLDITLEIARFGSVAIPMPNCELQQPG